MELIIDTVFSLRQYFVEISTMKRIVLLHTHSQMGFLYIGAN